MSSLIFFEICHVSLLFLYHEQLNQQKCQCNVFQYLGRSNHPPFIGHLPFGEKVWILSEVGEIGCLEVSSSNEILCVSESSNEVIFKKKTKKRKRFTTRSGAAENTDNNDLENWVITPANSSGWFQIYNPASKKFLTSSKKSVKLPKNAKKCQKMPKNAKKCKRNL